VHEYAQRAGGMFDQDKYRQAGELMKSYKDQLRKVHLRAF
jgi:hypothetical protein